MSRLRMPDKRIIAAVMGATKTYIPSDFSNLVLWLEADSGVYTDAGKTTLAADGDAVYTWDDQSTANKDAVQATLDKRPLYKTNIANGLPVIRYDGIDDVLKTFNTASAAKSIFIVARKRSAIGAAASGLVSNGVNFQLLTDSDYGSGYEYYNVPGGDNIADLGGSVTNWTLVELIYADAATLTPYINGVVGTVSNPADDYSTITDLWIGGLNATPAGPGDFDVAAVIIYNQALSNANRIGLENYFFKKYGFT